MPLGGELIKHRGRIDHKPALRRVSSQENAVSRLQATSAPDQDG
jgi:hypothetical protein